ncbi:MAG: hypothetical protein A4E61_00161 [Syntrophorhabdus sp. PtaB.Bin184]|nr:MAG: hypothetical protein A4E61_00161 [Syntrophorhabdus sp. PtaB.Bin184]
MKGSVADVLSAGAVDGQVGFFVHHGGGLFFSRFWRQSFSKRCPFNCPVSVALSIPGLHDNARSIQTAEYSWVFLVQFRCLEPSLSFLHFPQHGFEEVVEVILYDGRARAFLAFSSHHLRCDITAVSLIENRLFCPFLIFPLRLLPGQSIHELIDVLLLHVEHPLALLPGDLHRLLFNGLIAGQGKHTGGVEQFPASFSSLGCLCSFRIFCRGKGRPLFHRPSGVVQFREYPKRLPLVVNGLVKDHIVIADPFDDSTVPVCEYGLPWHRAGFVLPSFRWPHGGCGDFFDRLRP